MCRADVILNAHMRRYEAEMQLAGIWRSPARTLRFFVLLADAAQAADDVSMAFPLHALRTCVYLLLELM